MRKNFLYFMAAAGAAGLLTACGGAKQPAETAAQTVRESDTGGNVPEETPQASETSAPEETGGEAEEGTAQAEHLHPVIRDHRLDGGNEQSYPVTVRYQGLELSGEEGRRFPELKRALEQSAEEKAQNAEDTFAQLTESAAELYRQDSESGLRGENDAAPELSSETRTEVFRADTTVLSFRESYTDYWGGAHGYYAYFGVNYEVQTGKKLALTDVVADMDAFADLVMEKLAAEYPDLEYLDSRENIRSQVQGGDSFQWLLGNDGLRVYFNPYDITNYAAGMQTVLIPYAERPELFRPEYAQVPATWIQPVSLTGTDADGQTDWNGDGVPERFAVTGITDEYGNITAWRISLDEAALELETWAYSGEIYLIKDREDLYVYAFSHTDNDYVYLQAADFGGGTPVQIGENVDVSPDSVYNPAENGWDGEALTDPSSMKLDSRLNCLSTYSGSKVYHTGKDGLPESAQAWYLFCGEPRDLTLLKEKTAVVVDEDGNAEGKTKLAAGTVLRILRTDGADYCDFTLEDGNTIVRMETETGSWPQLVGGEPAEEVFDGMMFAG